LGTINLTAIEEFKAQSERMNFLNEQNSDLLEALQILETAITKIDNESRQRFKDTFDKINVGLQEKFPKLLSLYYVKYIKTAHWLTFPQPLLKNVVHLPHLKGHPLHPANDNESRQRFKDTFDKINVGLQEKFPKLFGGGKAYLSLTGDDLLESGVNIIAQPPGKRNSSINLLSGGEKALTAVALVFSIFDLNPAPFCLHLYPR
jgi:chromosome segregation ATPase